MRSTQILQSLVPDEELSEKEYELNTHQFASLRGMGIRIYRSSLVGAGSGIILGATYYYLLSIFQKFDTGWGIHVPNETALQVYHSIRAAGKDLGVVNAGYRAYDSLALENGTFRLTCYWEHFA
jgi:hypothetical protein